MFNLPSEKEISSAGFIEYKNVKIKNMTFNENGVLKMELDNCKPGDEKLIKYLEHFIKMIKLGICMDWKIKQKLSAKLKKNRFLIIIDFEEN